MQKIALEFSGGKDSLAILHLHKGILKHDNVFVIFGDTGAVYPHVVEFVHKTCAELGAKLIVASPAVPIRDHIAANGLPTDLLPTWSDPARQWHVKDGGALLQNCLECCGANLFGPVEKAVREGGFTDVIRGSKYSDDRITVPNGFVADGVTYWSPIWDWTHDDVFAYLKSIGAAPMKHYGAICDSLDCYICPAYMDIGHGAAKLKWTKEHCPDLWPELAENVRKVRKVVSDAFGRYMDSTKEAENV